MSSAVNKDHAKANEEHERALRSQGFKSLPAFFLLKECSIPGNGEDKEIRLTKERLQKIADIQNDRLAFTGDSTPIVIGHTVHGRPEETQPRIVGWATRFEVAKLNNSIWGLRAVPWCLAKDEQAFRNHPRRSVEFWNKSNMIDPISLLGATTPCLDLGVHRFQKSDGTWHQEQPIQLECKDMADDIDTDTGGEDSLITSDSAATPENTGDASFTQTAEWKQMQQTVQQLQQIVTVLQPLIEEIMQGGMGGEPGLDGGGDPGAGGPGAPPPGGAPAGPPPVQANMGGGPAGGTNTMVPQQMSMNTMHLPPQVQDILHQQHNLIQKLQQDLANQQKELAATKLQKATDEVNFALQELSKEIVIDPDYDRNQMVRLSRADQEKYVVHLRKTRAKVIDTQPPFAAELPLHLHLQQQVTPATGEQPIQFSKAVEQFQSTGLQGDPQLFQKKPVNSSYDDMIKVIRNGLKGSGSDAYDAYLKVMNATPPSDATGIKLRNV